METNGLPLGMFPNMGPQSLGLEMSLHNYHQSHPLPPPNHHHHHSIVSFTDQNPQAPSYPFGSKGKTHKLTLSDDDEDDAAVATGDDRGNISPWQRMKWTDSMVRLLIMVVFYIGDEVGSEEPPASMPAMATAKKKSGGILQKKGKWKSVSRAMFERGFNVSPQQCEDKFNDLNKRYKRVNDILGRGTACKVVENQSLLDSMDHLSPKMKDEVKKLLNSKHLFFREMCAYHNSCGSNGNGVLTTPVTPKPSCLHSSENTQNTLNVESFGSKSKSFKDDDDEDEIGIDSDDEDAVDMNRRGDFDKEDERFSRKRGRNGEFDSNLGSVQEFNAELTKMVQDSSKTGWEKREWMRNRRLKLEEQKVGYLCATLEIEKQRMKWLKFSSKKEREIETEKIVNERLKLENERMVLVLRQKEIEFTHFHNLNHKMGDPPSSMTG
jgi:hypothetical protein